MNRHKEADLLVGDPLSDAVSSALLCAGQESSLVDNTVEDLFDRSDSVRERALARVGARLPCATHLVEGHALIIGKYGWIGCAAASWLSDRSRRAVMVVSKTGDY